MLKIDLMRGVVPLLAAVALAATATGCSVRQDVALSPDGAGEAVLAVDLHPIMIDYMNDLMSAMTGVEGEYPLFDLDQIVASIAERDDLELLAATLPSRGTLAVAVRFADINELFAREGGGDILRLVDRGADRELTIVLNREAVERFLEFAPEESTTMAEFLFPPADGSVSREEYRSEMAWALEEYDDRLTVERVLDEATIDVWIRPRGTIVSQTGGRVEDGAVLFSLPILEVLTMAGERTYSVVFAP